MTRPPEPAAETGGSAISLRVTRAARGPGVILVAAVIAGGVGFVLTFIVARAIGAAAAAQFTAFWSGLYLVVGALAGVQQEVARTSRELGPGEPASPTLVRFAALAAAASALLAAAVAAFWVWPVFADRGAGFLLPLAVGPAGYVLTAIVCGALYGLRRWTSIAAMVIGDAVLRLVVVLIVLGITRDVLAIAWAVALPFFGTLAILWWFIRSGLRGRVRSDVPLGRLTANAAQAVAGSLALAILVSGFSLVTVATSGDVSPARLGAFVFAVTVVRAPIMVGVMSAQSLLVITFRDHPAPVRRALVIAGAVLLAGLIAAVVAALIGDPILAAVVGPDFRVGAPTLFVIVVSSALMGALFVTGPLALSRSRHTIYAVGTIAAAVTSVAALLIPVDFSTRTTLALLVAPAVGLLFHAVGIALIPRRA